MRLSHVHCRVRDLQAATHWFEQVCQATPVFNNERMVWLSFGELGAILDAAPADSTVTLGFDSEDCDADYRTVTGRGAETIEAPLDRSWGARVAYLKGPGGLTVELEQLRTATETHLNSRSLGDESSKRTSLFRAGLRQMLRISPRKTYITERTRPSRKLRLSVCADKVESGHPIEDGPPRRRYSGKLARQRTGITRPRTP
jgi:catechol 2,3-dioxygenase-like lactoylglutathione lyase family enzyme